MTGEFLRRAGRTLASTLIAAGVLALAGCGGGAPIPDGPPAADLALAAGVTAGVPLLPDFQTTLRVGADGHLASTWYVVRTASGSPDADAADLAALPGAPQGLHDYLVRHQGPVAVYVGGIRDEAVCWVDPLPGIPSEPVPSLVLRYDLDRYAGPGHAYFDPSTNVQRSTILPVDGVEGLRNYEISVRYGAVLLDRVIAKLEAAGAPEVRVLGHSKGADVCARAVYDPALHLDRRTDPRLATVVTFAMPVIAPQSPSRWGFTSAGRHWGGFFRCMGGKLVIYNRDSDFVTYGGWFDRTTHDYRHLVSDSPLGPYPGDRRRSPTWSPSENFWTRLQTFLASDATADQTPETLSYDW